MTLGIVTCFDNAVILIADGIVSKVSNNEQIVSDDDKIHLLTSNIGCIEFGETNATNIALANIDKQALQVAQTPAMVLEVVSKGLLIGRDLLDVLLASNVDRKMPALKAGLLVAGYIPKSTPEYFIGGVLYGLNGPPSEVLQTTPEMSHIMGSQDQANAVKVFQRNLYEIAPTETTTITSNPLVDYYLKVGAKTIRDVEKIDPTVGGTIRYLVITQETKISGIYE